MGTPTHPPVEVPLVLLAGRALQALRKAAGLSQRRLAAKIGVHGSAIGLLESGRIRINFGCQWRIEAALQIPPGTLQTLVYDLPLEAHGYTVVERSCPDGIGSYPITPLDDLIHATLMRRLAPEDPT